MKKYFFAITIVLTLLFSIMACDPLMDLPSGVILKSAVKTYPKGSTVTPEQLIEEVLKNETYIQFTNSNLEHCTFTILSEIDTSTVGKKRVEFSLQNKMKSFSNLYIYLFIVDDSTQVVENPPHVLIEDFSFVETNLVLPSKYTTYQIPQPTFVPENTNQRDLLYTVTSGDTVATVNSLGLVTRKDFGTVEITIKSYYNPALSKTITIEFSLTVAIESADFSQEVLITSADTVDLNSLLVLTPPNTTQNHFNWLVTPSSVASCVDGTLTRLKYGKVTVTATNRDKADIIKSIKVIFEKVAEESVTLQGLADSSLNKSYAKVLAIDFNQPTLPTGVSFMENADKIVKNGYCINDTVPVAKLIIKSNLITGWKYIEVRLKTREGTTNLWMRGQTDEDNCGHPITFLRGGKWGQGWQGTLQTNFTYDNEFQTVGLLRHSRMGYYLKERQFVTGSETNCNSFISGLTHPDFTFRIQDATATIEYIAFYK